MQLHSRQPWQVGSFQIRASPAELRARRVTAQALHPCAATAFSRHCAPILAKELHVNVHFRRSREQTWLQLHSFVSVERGPQPGPQQIITKHCPDAVQVRQVSIVTEYAQPPKHLARQQNLEDFGTCPPINLSLLSIPGFASVMFTPLGAAHHNACL